LNRQPSPREFNEGDIDWESFKVWLEKHVRPKTVKDKFSYAKKYVHCLLQRDFSELILASLSKRQHALKGLSALSKFCGVYDDFRALIKNYGLKWAGKRSEGLIIERLTRTINGEDLSRWFSSVQQVSLSCQLLWILLCLLALDTRKLLMLMV
jgi:hypothetical protein